VWGAEYVCVSGGGGGGGDIGEVVVWVGRWVGLCVCTASLFALSNFNYSQTHTLIPSFSLHKHTHTHTHTGWKWPIGQSLTKGDHMVVFFRGTMFPGGWETDFNLVYGVCVCVCMCLQCVCV
jgi:hypothetical protein